MAKVIEVISSGCLHKARMFHKEGYNQCAFRVGICRDTCRVDDDEGRVPHHIAHLVYGLNSTYHHRLRSRV